MKVSLIVAMADNNAIGVDNQLPWHLPADLKYFKAVTMGKPIIMGRKTFESIGRPLPGRQNIVITRNQDWTSDGVTIVRSTEQAVAAASTSDEVMVIGGAEIYRAMLPLVNKLYVTEVALSVEGDAFFPNIDPVEWQEVSRKPHAAEADKPAYAFVTFERVS
ncbi:MAG: type 3 dihydrofolate reductase [Kordiimonadaceae bacterium]|nr:type 3 dihydrofolate reductase [Kordiimonadaceae bacterium]MBO6569010.1 type 3 dihydrofolate reductase [Kordiimonadaceae bacterium]MBO6964485.1 type 3 dihydrofolate reductase [Kordiimonadaceae bacterium]